MPYPAKGSRLRLILLCFLLGGAGVLLADYAIPGMFGSAERFTLLQSAKDLIFSPFSGTLLYGLLLASRAPPVVQEKSRVFFEAQTGEQPATQIFFSWRALGWSLAALIVTLAVGLAFVAAGEKKRIELARGAALNTALAHAQQLSNHLLQNLASTHALGALVRQGGGKMRNFEAIAAQMLNIYQGVTAFQLAPNGIISRSYPLAGNENEIGHDLLMDPVVNIDTFDAIVNRKLTVARPFDLIHNGRVIIGHLPVFIQDRDGYEKFWGFVCAVIGMPELVKASGLKELARQGYRYELMRIAADTELTDLLAQSSPGPLSDPVNYVFEVPNGRWMLSIAPEKGWHSDGELTRELVLVSALSLLVAFAVFSGVRQPEQLRELVRARTRALAQNRDELQKLSTAVTQNPTSVVITDLDGNIEYVNPKFEQLTGYSCAEVKGKNPRIIQSGITPDEVYRDLWQTIKSGEAWRGEIQNRKKSGELFWESEIISPIKNDEGQVTHFIAVKEDITEQKRAEQRLQKLNRTLRMISECNEALVRSTEEQELVDLICRQVVEIGGYRMAWVGYAETDGEKTVKPVAVAGHEAGFLSRAKLTWGDGPRGRGTTGTAIRTGAVQVAGDLLTNPRYAPWQADSAERGYASAIALPLKDGATVFGMLGIKAGEPDAFIDEEVKLLSEMSDDLAYGIVSIRTRDQHRRAVRALQESAERFRTISNAAQDGIIMIDERGTVTYWNPAAERMFGYPSAAMVGRDLHEAICPERYRKDAEKGFQHFVESGAGPLIGRVAEMAAMRADGGEFPIEMALSAVTIGGKHHAVGLVRDITERKRHLEQLEHQATHDPLTELPNRLLLKDRIEQAIVQAQRHQAGVAVMLVDLDRFKNVNDSLGHQAGDELLRAVAERFQDLVRKSDTVARFATHAVGRLGGDEFVLVFTDVTNDERVITITQRIMAEVTRPLRIQGREFSVTCSIGISLHPRDGADAETLLKNADAAMYQAKDAGRNGYQFFTEDLNVRVMERLLVEAELRRALQEQEFCLYYQPQLDLATGHLIGMEALVRWKHPKRGLVAPGLFIPIAEESGLIVPIGEWVLREACHQNKAWQDAGYPAVPVAVNLSALQFRQKNLVKSLTRILAESGLPPRFLELEITESIVMHDVEWVIEQLQRFKERGIKLSIDDFGTGYSSLNYLRRFPVDRLKIDMSFVREIATEPDAAAITTLIIGIGHTLKMRVIAEGVETQEQLSVLRKQDCDQAQGYLFSKPLPPEEFAGRFAKHEYAGDNVPGPSSMS